MSEISKKQHGVDSGVDLLRCLLMLGVVLHHAICFSQDAIGRPFLPLWLMTIPAVDGFLVISGWYGVRFTWGKWLKVAGQIVFYGVLLSGVSVILARGGLIPSSRIGIGQAWYGVAYLALMVFCPIINAGVEKLREKATVYRVAAPLAVVFVIDWLSRCIGLGFSVSGFGSHTFATFLGVYTLIRLLREEVEQRARMAIVCGMCAFALYEGIFCIRGAIIGAPTVLRVVGDWGFYNCPLIVLSALALFLVFKQIRVPTLIARIAHFIAPSTFAVYLISDANAMMKEFFLHKVISSCGIVGGSVVMFFLCVLFDVMVRRQLLGMVKLILEKMGLSEVDR